MASKSTDLSILKNHVVCIKHFRDSGIIKTEKCIVAGELKEFQKEIKRRCNFYNF